MSVGQKDLTLPSGKTVNLDLNRITRREFKSLFDKSQPDEEEDAVLGKVYGMSGDEFASLGMADTRVMIDQFFKAAREPLSDPN